MKNSKKWENWKFGLMMIVGGPALCSLCSLWGLIGHNFKWFWMFCMAVGGLPCIVVGVLMILGWFKDFEFQAGCVLYFGTMLGGSKLAEWMNRSEKDLLPYILAFAFALSVSLAWYFGRKASKKA